MAERRGIKRMNTPEASSTPRITQAAPVNCQTLGAVPVMLVIRSNDLMIQAAAAQAGAGIALLPHFVGQELGLERLAGTRSLQREIWQTVHDDIRHAPGIAAVTAFLLDCYADVTGITRLVDTVG
jgi:DNA-binding transcriptional LysR family regulator